MVDSITDISSIGDLLIRLKTDSSPNSTYWYRGQSQADWKLIPSLARPDNDLRSESHLIERFKQNATLLLQPLPANDWEWLTIMQHHRVPTRLLDWSESPLVGLYFALSDVISGNEAVTDGALWVLNPVELNWPARIPNPYPLYIPSFNDEIVTNNYSTLSVATLPSSGLQPLALIGQRNTRRMQAQLGTFTIIHRDPIVIEDVGDSRHILKYTTPKDAKLELRRELSLLGVDKFQLFPELESLGEMLRGN